MATGRIELDTKWGPFSPSYLGISRILDEAEGAMADMALVVGRTDPATVLLPETTFGYVPQQEGKRRAEVFAVPEDVATDYSSYALRYFLDPHGDTAVARFTAASDQTAVCEVTFANTSDTTREYHYGVGVLASDARKRVFLKERLRPWWIAARDYTEIEAYRKTFGLGCRQCLTRVYTWAVEVETLAQAFGCWAGDRVVYRATLPEPLRNGYLYLRYVKFGTVNPDWEVRINGRPTTFRFVPTAAIPGGGWGKNRDAYEEWGLLRVPVGPVPATDLVVELRPIDPPGNDRSRIWLDGLLFNEGILEGDDGSDGVLPTTLIDEVDADTIRVELAPSQEEASARRKEGFCGGQEDASPEASARRKEGFCEGQEDASPEASASALESRPPDRPCCNTEFRIVVPGEVEHRLSLATDAPPRNLSEGSGSFIAALRQHFALPWDAPIRDSNACPWARLEAAPVTVPAQSERTVRFTMRFELPLAPPVVQASRLHPATAGSAAKLRAGRSCHVTNASRDPGDPSPCASPYADMISHLRDVTLFNVNYPIRLFGPPTPYFVPAKFFPIPYSWDGGFAAVGMATFAPDLALQQASFFLADKEHDFPMLFAGSPVPTPLYALWEIYQTTQDPTVLAGTYAGAKRMYDFYLGRTPGSIVNAYGDGMLSTYPYNYNLGIDDHPIQRLAEERKITERGLYSLILMAQILRLARVMRNVAHLTGHEADVAQYAADAERLAGIIEDRMWDEKSGLYGWLYRTDDGVAPFVMAGSAGDRTGCAFFPLFAGQTAHKARLIAQMEDPRRFQTPYGISSVDMSAPYYNPRGYWNGGIWPVMQWYLWRGLLEAGEPERARKLAVTILQTWQDCFTKDHYLGEHFNIAEAQMNGVPNFAGLDAALLPMHAAYFMPYHVAPRYDVMLRGRTVDKPRDTLQLTLTAPFIDTPEHDLLVNMGRGHTRYAVYRNGTRTREVVTDAFGHACVRLPRPAGTDELRIEPA